MTYCGWFVGLDCADEEIATHSENLVVAAGDGVASAALAICAIIHANRNVLGRQFTNRSMALWRISFKKGPLTQVLQTKQFETEFAAYLQHKHNCVTCN